MTGAPHDDPEVAYFREIERAFVERRGDPLFISNADWVFLAKLRKKGVPMRIVLRGMTDAFDAHAHSFSRKQKIRTLKFCEPEITAAVDRYRRALQSDGPSRRGLSGAIEKLQEELGAVPPRPELEGAIAVASRRLKEIADAAKKDKAFEAQHPLSKAEDVLVGAATEALGEGERATIEQKTRDAVAAYKSRMPKNVLEALIEESVRRKILQRFGLPRFLLTEIG